MQKILFIFGSVIVFFAGCTSEPSHRHEHPSPGGTIQLTGYSQEFEVFAEADPWVVGKPSGILSHLTFLSTFKPVEEGRIKLRLIIGETEESQILDKPDRKGIYRFTLTPKTPGKGQLIYEMRINQQSSQVIIPDIMVYPDEQSAWHAAQQEEMLPGPHAVVYTKEQSWKADFATEFPRVQPFGQAITTTARIEPVRDGIVTISARTNGLVTFTKQPLLEGQTVQAGQVLFTLSGSELADNNATVRFIEAKTNYEAAKADYTRKAELIPDKIVSERDFIRSKTDYENARAVYEHLQKNFNAAGQLVTSPLSGYVKQLFVHNGQYAETGQPLLRVLQNKQLLLRTDVPPKYAPLLGSIVSATIRTLPDNRTYTWEELQGKVLSWGRSTGEDNSFIPVYIRVENTGHFVVGSFVEIILQTLPTAEAITVPNSALLEEQGNYFVFVQITPELFEKRAVKTGTTDGLRTEVREGILPTERVVSRGAVVIKLSQSAGTLDAHSGHVH